MAERKCKLNEDMHKSDCMFNPITFEDIILALHCNEKMLDEKAVQKVVREIMFSRMEDFMYIIKNNMNEIIAEAMKGRN